MIFRNFYDLCYAVDSYVVGRVLPTTTIIFVFFLRKVLENKIFTLSLHPQSDGNIGCRVQKILRK